MTHRFAEFGAHLRSLRKASPVRDVASFAKSIDLSKEGLRKIEVGQRLANRDTLEKFLDAAHVVDPVRSQVLRERDELQAKRDGGKGPKYLTLDQIEESVNQIVGYIVELMDLNEIEVSSVDKMEMKADFRTMIKEKLGA